VPLAPIAIGPRSSETATGLAFYASRRGAIRPLAARAPVPSGDPEDETATSRSGLTARARVHAPGLGDQVQAPPAARRNV
jgi:hypothetical protein